MPRQPKKGSNDTDLCHMGGEVGVEGSGPVLLFSDVALLTVVSTAQDGTVRALTWSYQYLPVVTWRKLCGYAEKTLWSREATSLVIRNYLFGRKELPVWSRGASCVIT